VRALPAIRRGSRVRADLVAAGVRLVNRGLAVGSVGNLSARTGDGVVITPTRMPYTSMSRRDLVRVDLAGRVCAGHRPPSRELELHLAIYLARPDVRAIVHTHSVYATAWSFLAQPLAPRIEDLDYYGVDEVRTAPPAPPGSHRLAATAPAALGDSAAVLLAGHGVVTAAKSIEEALAVAEVVERQAQVAWLLRMGPAEDPGAAAPGQNIGAHVQTLVQNHVGSIQTRRGVGRW
jgi:L-fuculose-phosphate aldolase